jgi:hypothetical protein
LRLNLKRWILKNLSRLCYRFEIVQDRDGL